MEVKYIFPAEILARVAKEFHLDKLEVRILLEAKGKTPLEIAQELGELPSPIELRIASSIPLKFKVKTLAEAREKIQIQGHYFPEEDQFIIRNCKRMSCREMASYLRRSEDSVEARVGILKRLKRIKRSGFVRYGVFYPRFTEEQNRIIKERYPNGDIKLLMSELKLSEKALRQQAIKLGVRRALPTYLNSVKIAALLRVAQRTVVKWLNLGYLKGGRSGRGAGPYQGWRIEPQDFYNFVRDYPHLCEGVGRRRRAEIRKESVEKVL